MHTGTKKLPKSEILVPIHGVISWSTPQPLHQAINLFIIIQVMKRQSTIKFLGILLTEKKVAKNIAQHKVTPYLNKDSLLALYFSYINYANLG